MFPAFTQEDVARAAAQVQHTVAVRVGGKVIEGWSEYQVELDMLQPADAFSLSIGPARKAVVDLCCPDAEVRVILDGTTILTGYIDEPERTVGRGGSKIAIRGRDKSGRLVDESAPLVSFGSTSIQELAKQMAAPWFDDVVLSNTKNRDLLRGYDEDGAPLARASREPAIDTAPKAKRKVSPGDTRWKVLEHFLTMAEVLAWSTGDGRHLVIGLPNYDQEPQYRFFLPKEGSAREAEGNVLDFGYTNSVAERYSRIVVLGMATDEDDEDHEHYVVARGEAKNGPGAHGEGKDFARQKELTIADDDVHDARDAQMKAAREMAVRDGAGRRIKLKVQGHDQEYRPGQRVLYAPDTMAQVEDEEMGTKAAYLVTAVTFSRSRSSGEETTLQLAPKGTVLRL
jgi:prophage tail gpP-like protein